MSGGSYKAKQLIIMRKDLHMRKGKIAAQASHASVEAVLMALAHNGRQSDITLNDEHTYAYLAPQTHETYSDDITPLDAWFEAGVAKICVYVSSEDELLCIVDKGRQSGFLVALIKDAGLTEFHGEATYTCCAFEPLFPEQIDPITADLPLY